LDSGREQCGGSAYGVSCHPDLLAGWLAWLFATFGLQAPANPTVIGGMLVCALSIAAAVILVVDMAHPYIGVIHVSDVPSRTALMHIGK
jgi:hypothetical protein